MHSNADLLKWGVFLRRSLLYNPNVDLDSINTYLHIHIMATISWLTDLLTHNPTCKINNLKLFNSKSHYYNLKLNLGWVNMLTAAAIFRKLAGKRQVVFLYEWVRDNF